MAVPEALIVVADTKNLVSVGVSRVKQFSRSLFDACNPALQKVLHDQYIALCRDQTLVVSTVVRVVTGFDVPMFTYGDGLPRSGGRYELSCARAGELHLASKRTGQARPKFVKIQEIPFVRVFTTDDLFDAARAREIDDLGFDACVGARGKEYLDAWLQQRIT